MRGAGWGLCRGDGLALLHDYLARPSRRVGHVQPHLAVDECNLDPGWDGLYARGVVGLMLKDCVFVSAPSPPPARCLRPLPCSSLTRCDAAGRTARIGTASA